MNFGQIAVSAFGGTTVALVAAGFLAKTIYKHWLKKDFKRFEDQINRLAAMQQVRFVKLHEERAELIKNLHKQIVVLDDRLSFAIALTQIEKTGKLRPEYNVEEWWKAVNAASDYIIQFRKDNEIYFSKIFIEQLRRIENAFEEYGASGLKDYYPLNPETANQRNVELVTIRKYLDSFLEQLRDEFRMMLGVEI